jgi:hypothetical protein
MFRRLAEPRAIALLYLSLVALSLADMALTYAIVASGAGYEANPAWSAFNADPSAVWSRGLPSSAVAWGLFGLLAAAAWRLPIARRPVAAAMLAASAFRAAVVANNAAVLFLHVDILPLA